MTETHSALQDLVALLDLENAAPDLYRGVSPSDRWQRVFGGQVLGQALVAATRTIEGRYCHSLHAYFLRPGDPKTPILYRVERSHDGNSFASRRVTALQNERQIFIMDASFQIHEEGIEHQLAMPDVKPPEEFRSEREWRLEFADAIPPELQEYFLKERPIEIRPLLIGPH